MANQENEYLRQKAQLLLEAARRTDQGASLVAVCRGANGPSVRILCDCSKLGDVIEELDKVAPLLPKCAQPDLMSDSHEVSVSLSTRDEWKGAGRAARRKTFVRLLDLTSAAVVLTAAFAQVLLSEDGARAAAPALEAFANMTGLRLPELARQAASCVGFAS